MVADILSGTFQYDFIVFHNVTGFLNAVSNDAIIPLDQYIDFQANSLYESLQSASLWKGKHYGLKIPVDSTHDAMMLYNRDMLEVNGLPDIF